MHLNGESNWVCAAAITGGAGALLAVAWLVLRRAVRPQTWRDMGQSIMRALPIGSFIRRRG